MAQNSELPIDGDNKCMTCKEEPASDDILLCKTCNTPWHTTCLLSPPETLASTLNWDCPDCSTLFNDNTQSAVPVPVQSSDLVASIRAIEADASLTEAEKAKKRQDLMSKGVNESKESKDKEKEEVDDLDVFDLFDGTFNCSFCMQLPERPVTTPCGHNFCLKCFQKWTGQGKRTCAKCRNAIPPKMASNPRINSSLVIAIRMARTAQSRKSTCTSQPLKVHNFVHNYNRPDKAYTTERAKKTGKANACSGKIFVTVPSDHFGPILAENDPARNQGVLVGECWEDRLECRQWGTHLPHVSGIAGQSDYGAQSVALSGGYQDDEDHGEWFLYTGSGGRDLSGNKRTNKDQSFDQKFEKYNEALRVSCNKGYPVRVVRSHKEKRSSYAPETGVRYDGIYRIEKCWRKTGIQGFKVCRYLFVRCDNEPAPWTSDEHGDQPRPLPVIKELKNATDITSRKEKASWDYDEMDGCWKWKIPPPKSRKGSRAADSEIIAGWDPRQVENVDPEERNKAMRARKQAQNLALREKLLKEFSCLICRKVMTLPLTTPCAHNFCKHCLEGAFAGQTILRERTCGGRRVLRAQKNIMKCPSCPMEISDFIQNPQINRELMDVIASLQHKTEENIEEAEGNVEGTIKEENEGTEEKQPEVGIGETEICTGSFAMLEGNKKVIENSPTKGKLKQKNIDDKQNSNSLLKKSGDDTTDIDVNYAKPESGKEEQKTPATNKRQKRKKADDGGGSVPSGVRTRSNDGDKNHEKSESGNEELRTPTTDKKRKRKQAEDDGGSVSSGVRTRSMKAKELIDGEGACGSKESKGKHPNKRKKANDAGSVLRLSGVGTRCNKS